MTAPKKEKQCLPVRSLRPSRKLIPLGWVFQSEDMLFRFASQNSLARTPLEHCPALHGIPKYI